MKKLGLLFIGCIVGIVLGRLSVKTIDVSVESRPGREKPDKLSALVEKMTNDPFLVLKGPNDTTVSIVRNDTLQSIRGASVWNYNKNAVYMSFHDSGTIASIELRYKGGYLRTLKFREDGSVEIETVFEPGGNLGTRKHFDEKGSHVKTDKIKIMHGS
jgi:hypothetical protein